MSAEHQPVARVAVPPEAVVRQGGVAVGHGRSDVLGVGEVEGVQARRLVDDGGVLERPGVLLVAGLDGFAGAEQGEDAAGALGAVTALVQGRGRDGAHPLADGHGGTQSPVQLGDGGQQVGVGPADVVGDPVVQLRPGVAAVAAGEAERIVGVGDVVRAHPADHVQVIPAVQQQVGVLELLGHDPGGIAAAGAQVVVQAEPGTPVGLQGEGAEALPFDQVPQGPMPEGDEVVGAVGGLADADHHGVADRLSEGTQVLERLRGLDGAQGTGGLLECRQWVVGSRDRPVPGGPADRGRRDHPGYDDEPDEQRHGEPPYEGRCHGVSFPARVAGRAP